MKFDKSRVKVLVEDKKQAKQFKAILVGLGEPISQYYWMDDFGSDQTDLIYNSDNLWAVGCNQVNHETISIKELIQRLSIKEEPKRKFVMKSEDGVDLFVGDYFYVAAKRAMAKIWRLDYHNGPSEIKDTTKFRFGEAFVNSCVYGDKENNKAFSTKEAALKWIEEQNKPKEISYCLHNSGSVYANISAAQIRFKSEVAYIAGSDIEKIYTAYKSLQS